MDMGMLSPGGGTWRYNAKRNLLLHDPLQVYLIGWRPAVGCGLVPPLHMVTCFLMEGGSKSRSASILPPDASACRCRSAFKLGFILWIRRRISPWSRTGYRRVDTFVSMRLHVSAKIHVFLLASRALGFGVARRRAAKSLSSLVGVDGYEGWSACTTQGTLCVTSGWRYRGTPISCNDMSCY